MRTLTKKGEEHFLKAHHAAKKSVANFFEDKISDKEAKELRRILHKIMK